MMRLLLIMSSRSCAFVVFESHLLPIRHSILNRKLNVKLEVEEGAFSSVLLSCISSAPSLHDGHFL